MHSNVRTGEDDTLKDVLSKEGGAGEAGLDASRHFSYYALVCVCVCVCAHVCL
jgi:hypothetical protein